MVNPRGSHSTEEFGKTGQRRRRSSAGGQRTRFLVGIIRIRPHAVRLLGQEPFHLVDARRCAHLLLVPVRLDRDDPDAREEDGGSETDEPELKRREHLPLVVVDEARDDGREVVETKGEGANEGGSDEAKGAIQVEELSVKPKISKQSPAMTEITHLKNGGNEQHEYDEPCFESTKLRKSTPVSTKPLRARKGRTWFCPTTVRMSSSMPVLANSKHSPLSVPDAAPYATPKMSLVRSIAAQLINSLTSMLSVGSSELVHALTAGSVPLEKVAGPASDAVPPVLVRDTSDDASLPFLATAPSSSPYRSCCGKGKEWEWWWCEGRDPESLRDALRQRRLLGRVVRGVVGGVLSS